MSLDDLCSKLIEAKRYDHETYTELARLIIKTAYTAGFRDGIESCREAPKPSTENDLLELIRGY